MSSMGTSVSTTRPILDPAVDASILEHLPRWTDAGSVTSYIVAAAGIAEAVIATVDPSLKLPASALAVLPAIGLVVALVAQALNATRHTRAHSHIATQRAAAEGQWSSTTTVSSSVGGGPATAGSEGAQGAQGVAPGRFPAPGVQPTGFVPSQGATGAAMAPDPFSSS